MLAMLVTLSQLKRKLAKKECQLQYQTKQEYPYQNLSCKQPCQLLSTQEKQHLQIQLKHHLQDPLPQNRRKAKRQKFQSLSQEKSSDREHTEQLLWLKIKKTENLLRSRKLNRHKSINSENSAMFSVSVICSMRWTIISLSSCLQLQR